MAKKGRSLKRKVSAVLLVLGVVYAGIHLLSRTDGVRSAVADKISNWTRLPVALEECAATPRLGLRLKGLSFLGVEMPEVILQFNWLALFSETRPLVQQLDLYGPEIKLKRIPATGSWEPLALHGVGSRLGAVMGLNPPHMPGSDKIPQFPPSVISEKTLLQLARAKISWCDERGRELAYITEGDLRVKTRAFMDRKVIQSIVSCGHIRLASGQMLREFRLEAFRYTGSDTLTILDMADLDGEYPEFATKTLWQDLNQQLNSLSRL